MKVNITHIFENIYKKESDAIFRFCFMRVSDREQALDITQETFTRFWQKLQKDEDIQNNRAFIFMIARNLIIDWYRKKKAISLDKMIENDLEDTPYFTVDDSSIDNLELGPESRYVLDKVNELPPSARDPIYMRFVEGLSPSEIGEILGISTNAASVRINRGLIELKKKTGYNDNVK